jgi:Phage integrase family
LGRGRQKKAAPSGQGRPARAALSSTKSAALMRIALRRTAAQAGIRRRFAPHQLRHAHAVEMAREGVPLIVIQRQLGPGNLGVTSIYLQGIDSGEIIETIRTRRPPVIPAAAALAGSCFRPKRLLLPQHAASRRKSGASTSCQQRRGFGHELRIAAGEAPVRQHGSVF